MRALSILVLTVATASPSGAGSREVVAERQAAMREMRQQVDIAEGMLRNRDRFDPATAEGIFRTFAENGQAIATLFPEGSDGRGSKARAAVWRDRAGFETALASFNDAVSRGAPQATSAEGFRRAYSSARQQCHSCHQQFRSR